MKLKVILTGATGMVGEGVLHECLHHNDVEDILIINRKPSGVQHLKLREIIHPDFFNLSPIADQLTGYNACFFCLGVSSVGMREPEYYRLTYTLTMHMAEILAKQNSDMIFCYISGASTDSSEKGRMMWARVKGKTENELMKLPFKKVYAFRPGYMHPTKGLKNTLKFYKYIRWLYPVFKAVMPNKVSTLKELGLAMIQAAAKGYPKQIVEVKDIHVLAKQ
ncbi:MAG TPA: NAD-dependent epimerase/dehydratase family protein [Chitinophagaceae bacterium]|nr:NAD-dependent epimerase/dehydratase family protein [Chitinophagaceae bacterium]